MGGPSNGCPCPYTNGLNMDKPIFSIGFYWTKCGRPLKKWSLLVLGFMDVDCPMVTKPKVSKI